MICSTLADSRNKLWIDRRWVGLQFVATVRKTMSIGCSRAIFPPRSPLERRSALRLKTGPVEVIPAEQRTSLPGTGLGRGGEIPISQNDPQGRQAAEPFFEVRTPSGWPPMPPCCTDAEGRYVSTLNGTALAARHSPAAATSAKALSTMITLLHEYRRTGHGRPKRLLKGLDASVNSLLGAYRRRGQILNELRRDAEKIDAEAPVFAALSEHHLRERVMEFRQKFRRGGRGVNDLTLSALAAIREVADRETGLRPFVVQLMGALASTAVCLRKWPRAKGKL
jgi:hypothetical protein